MSNGLSNTSNPPILVGPRISRPFWYEDEWVVTVYDDDVVTYHRFGGNVIAAGEFYLRMGAEWS